MKRGRHEDERSSRLSGLWAVAMAVVWHYNASGDPTDALLLLFTCRRTLPMASSAMLWVSLSTNQSGTDEKRATHRTSYKDDSWGLADAEYGRVIVVDGTCS